jgi:hypothetical protein
MGQRRGLRAFQPNNPVELTAHNAGFWAYPWRFPLSAAAELLR